MAGCRTGYEYSYGFWMDDEIIPLYNKSLRISTYSSKSYLFEIRTNFKLKSRVDEEVMMMGSERFGVAAVPGGVVEQWLDEHMSCRLKDYWMSHREIRWLVRDALNFTEKTTAADPQYATLSVIPVVVELDVWTVQQEGEPINETIDRAIRPKCLYPLHMSDVALRDSDHQVDEDAYLDDRKIRFLKSLRRIRVEDEEGLALMEVCPVCSRNSTIGAQISFCFNCNHACHSLCVFRWLDEGKYKCPSCDARILYDLDQSNSDFDELDAKAHSQLDSDSESSQTQSTQFFDTSSSFQTTKLVRLFLAFLLGFLWNYLV